METDVTWLHEITSITWTCSKEPLHYRVISNSPEQNGWKTSSISFASSFTKLEIAQAFPNYPC